MKNAKQIIKKRGREAYFDYYKSLGYDEETAAALTLFTYGMYSFSNLSMHDLYEAVSEGKEYLPQELLERRMRREQAMQFAPGRLHDIDYEASCLQMPVGRSKGTVGGMPLPKNAAPAARKHSSGLKKPAFLKSVFQRMSPDTLPSLADDSFEEGAVCLSPSLNREERPDPAGTAGAAGYATDEYEGIEEKNERSTVAEPTSTFRMTTNTASAGVILNQLRNGRRIDRSMVRIEELLNYFRYESELPREGMFNVTYELMDAENERKYLYINVQGKEEVRDRQNIIILLDVSGSMGGNAEQTQAIIATIVSKLGNGDKLSLVTYSSSDSVELEAFTVNGPEDRIRVLEKLLSVQINGCTYGSAGIEKAYKIGKKNYIEGGNNQVILITDGDLNFGITDKGGLEELIERRKKDNLFLSVIGTGLYNYRDDKLETLSKHGNGVYRTVNSLTDVKKSIDEEYASLVNIIAKDVKAQVEFNPEVVEAYRLLGFENRTLMHEDFTNDKVISEPFGSGGWGVALYELKLKTEDAPVRSTLKYSRLVTTGSLEPGTIKVRYKEPLEDVSHETGRVIETAEAAYTDNLRLAFIVYVCAEKLRGSDKISMKEIDLARKLYGELGSSIREKNAADLFKLAGILDKSEKELGIGIPEDSPFPW